jgi:hypothetical protein
MKNKLIIGLVVLVGLASVAYAAYAQVLNVNGTGTASGDWDVAITDITQTSATGATDNTPPTFDTTSATFDVNLAYPGATATYDVTVTNNGSIPAILSNLTDLTATNTAAPTYITYDITGVTAGSTTLAANGGTNVMHVTATWDSGTSPDTSTGNSKVATITMNYDQNP